MSGHKRIEEITSKFGGDWKDIVFNVDSQDYFLFVAQVSYERKLVEWALRLGNMDGSLENAYQETMFNPARYCAYMESLECVNNVVEVLCENIVLFTEFVYYTEFFEMTCLSYLKHILNVLLKKIILLVSFWCEIESRDGVMTCVKKQQEIKILANVFTLMLSLTYTNDQQLFYYLSFCGFSNDITYLKLLQKNLHYQHLRDYFKQQYLISIHTYDLAVNRNLKFHNVLTYCLGGFNNSVLYDVDVASQIDFRDHIMNNSLLSVRSLVEGANWFTDLTEDEQRYMLTMMCLHKDGNMCGESDWWIALDGKKCFISSDSFVVGGEISVWCKFVNVLINVDDFEVS